MEIKNILLILFFYLAQYNCYALDHELDHYTNRVAQSLYEGGNINLKEVKNICEEIGNLHKSEKKNTNTHLREDTLDKYKEILVNFFNYNNEEKEKHSKSINEFISVIAELNKTTPPETLNKTFFLILEKLS